MDPFAFQIVDAFDTPDGFEGEVTLAGVKIDGGDLVVGDVLLVPVRDGGHMPAVCTGFPLIRFTDPEVGALSISGLTTAEVLIGGQAEQP